MLQIFILAVVAIFLFWRLKAVLGSRDGFEKTLRDIKEPNDVIKRSWNNRSTRQRCFG